MGSFNFIKPTSLTEVSRLMAEHGDKAKLSAGCTDLIVQLRRKAINPETIISLRGIADLAYIVEEADYVRIGATTTMSDIAESELIVNKYPALAQAAGNIGSQLIQNSATIAGNICNASPAADTATPLLVYGAKVKIFNQGQEKIVEIAQFFKGVGKTVLQPGDVVAEILLPIQDANSLSLFMKQGRRKALEISILSVSVNLSFGDNGEITKAAIGCGAVAPTPVLGQKAASQLIGKVVKEEEDLTTVLNILAGEVSPISDIRGTSEYRQHMVLVLTKRAILELVQNWNGKGAKLA